MAARLGVFDDMMMMLKTAPCYPGSGLMHPDIVYDIEKRIIKSESELKEADWEKEKQRHG